jgi:hypothetical protein
MLAPTKKQQPKAFSNGRYLLEPRVLAPPQAISARSLKMLNKSAAQFEKRTGIRRSCDLITLHDIRRGRYTFRPQQFL